MEHSFQKFKSDSICKSYAKMKKGSEFAIVVRVFWTTLYIHGAGFETIFMYAYILDSTVIGI